MESWILVGAVHALYLIFALGMDGKRDISRFFLALLFFVIFFEYALAYISISFDRPELSLFLWNAGTLIAPLFVIYTRSLTIRKDKMQRYWLLFIPYIATQIYILSAVLFMNEEESLSLFMSVFFWRKPLVHIFFQVTEFACPILFGLLIIRYLKKHEQNVLREYSYTDAIDLHWLKVFTWLVMAVFLVFYASYYILPLFFPWVAKHRMSTGFVATIPLFFYLGYRGVKQKIVPRFAPSPSPRPRSKTESDSASLTSPENKYKKTGLAQKARQELALQLESVMNERRLYLKPKLSLEDLEKITGFSKHNISEVLNGELRTNFYEYVNRWRIRSFTERIRRGDHKQYTILSIALDSGFSSKASFNRIFKITVGSTPSEFVRTLDSEKRPDDADPVESAQYTPPESPLK